MSIATLINKTQAVLEMHADGEIDADKAIISLSKHIKDMAKISGKPASKKNKKSDSESDGEVKRKPNEFILFSSRIRAILKEHEAAYKDVGTHNQFCSHLKSIKPYDEWEDADEILEQQSEWVKPDVSKQEAAGKNKTSGRSSVADASDAEEAKPAKPAPKPVAKKPVEKPVEKPAKAKPAPKASEPAETKRKPGRPKKVVEEKTATNKKVAEAEEASDELDFEGFEHEGNLYLKSKEGYVVDTEGEWVGLHDGETIDTDAAEPDCVKEWREKNN